MPTSTIDWTIRMVMLVLAGLVTLSILSSIAAMTNNAVSSGSGVPVERATAPPPPPPGDDMRNEIVDAPAALPDEGRTATATRAVPAAVEERAQGAASAPPPSETARWLEAIAYALLALAGLLALAILLLWRGLRTLRRIADAAEARPRNQ